MTRRRQRGFSIVTAIFLIVILAALAGFAVSMFSAQQGGAMLDQQGYRALQAAQSGLDWGLYRVAQTGACPAATNLTFPAGTSLVLFRSSVQCTATAHQEAGVAVTIFNLTATACYPAAAGGVCPNPAAGADYVERQVQGMVER